jgi:hypothetical protein
MNAFTGSRRKVKICAISKKGRPCLGFAGFDHSDSVRVLFLFRIVIYKEKQSLLFKGFE